VLTAIVSFCCDLILPVIVGFMLRRLSTLDAKIMDRIMLLQLFLLLPISTALSFWVVSIEPFLLGLPFIGALMILLPGAMGLSYLRLRFQDPLEQGSFLLSVMLANRGVVGAISVFIIFGETGYAYAQLTMMLAPPIVYLLCFQLAQHFSRIGTHNNIDRMSFKSLFLHPRQLPLLGIILGLVLNICKIPRPKPLGLALPFLIHIGAWLFLVPIGYSFNPARIRPYIFKIWDILIIRHILTPGLIAMIGYLVGYRGTALSCLVVLSGSPVAITAVVVSKLFDLKTDLASSGFIMSTSFYLCLVFPMYYLLIRHVFM
jgi:predicted permease